MKSRAGRPVLMTKGACHAARLPVRARGAAGGDQTGGEPAEAKSRRRDESVCMRASFFFFWQITVRIFNRPSVPFALACLSCLVSRTDKRRVAAGCWVQQQEIGGTWTEARAGAVRRSGCRSVGKVEPATCCLLACLLLAPGPSKKQSVCVGVRVGSCDSSGRSGSPACLDGAVVGAELLSSSDFVVVSSVCRRARSTTETDTPARPCGCDGCERKRNLASGGKELGVFSRSVRPRSLVVCQRTRPSLVVCLSLLGPEWFSRRRADGGGQGSVDWRRRGTVLQGPRAGMDGTLQCLVPRY